MALDFSSVLARSDDLRDEVVDLRRRIHRRPEIGLELPETQNAILSSLKGLPLEVTTGRNCSSVVARLEGATGGPTVLLRGDMDALPLTEDTSLEFESEIPGAMHACGHDVHTAGLVGAAKLLAELRDQIRGNIVFMFQPGEEGYHGARVMIDEGLLETHRPDLVYALHVGAADREGAMAGLDAGKVTGKSGPILAAASTFAITVVGRGGHGSSPHSALDPVTIAAEIVGAIQTYVTRRINAFDPAVVTVTKLNAGTADNVIPETASLGGTIRTFSEKTRAKVVEGIERVSSKIAEAHGARAVVEITPGYPVTVNHNKELKEAMALAVNLFGQDEVVEMTSPIMGAEDFSYVLEQVPGAFLFVGCRPPTDGIVAGNHSNKFVVDEDCIPRVVSLYSALALTQTSG